MQNSEDTEISFSTHLGVFALNVLFVMLAVHFFTNGTVLIRDMGQVGGAPAEITIFLVFLCVLAIDYVYVKGILKHRNENI